MKTSNAVISSQEIIDQISEYYYSDHYYGSDELVKILLILLDATLENQLAIMAINPNYLKYIDNHADGLMIKALETYPDSIIFFPDAPESIKIKYINIVPGVIQNMKNPTEAMKIAAIDANAMTLQYIEDQSEYLVDMAVSKNCAALPFVKSHLKTLELQKKAIDSNPTKCFGGLSPNLPSEYINTILNHPLFIGNTGKQDSYKEILKFILSFENINANQLMKLKQQFVQKYAQIKIMEHEKFKNNAELILLNINEEKNQEA